MSSFLACLRSDFWGDFDLWHSSQLFFYPLLRLVSVRGEASTAGFISKCQAGGGKLGHLYDQLGLIIIFVRHR